MTRKPDKAERVAKKLVKPLYHDRRSATYAVFMFAPYQAWYSTKREALERRQKAIDDLASALRKAMKD